ncbi:MAG: hypothetical protein ACP5OK_07140, partial [Thermoprotei archaeon]
MVVRLVFVDFWGTLFKLEVPVDKYLDERSILFKKVLHNFGYNFSVEFLKERYQIVRTVVDSVRRALSLEVPLLVEIRSLVKVLGIDDNYDI